MSISTVGWLVHLFHIFVNIPELKYAARLNSTEQSKNFQIKALPNCSFFHFSLFHVILIHIMDSYFWAISLQCALEE